VISVSEYTEMLKDGLKIKLSKSTNKGRISKEEQSISKMLLDDESDPNECEKKIIRYMRKRYIPTDITKPNNIVRLKTEHGFIMGGLPNLLFWLKGKASGLYEYSKLTGGLSDALFLAQHGTVIWEDLEQKEALMRFAMYDLIINLARRDIDVFVLGKHALYSNRAEEIKRIIHKFGANNKVLSDFVVSYPFKDGSYIKVRENDFKDIDEVIIPKTEQLLCEYYDQLLTSTSQKLRFLRKVKNIYGRRKLAYLLTHISEKDTIIDKSRSFYERIIKFSIENRMWQNVTELLSKPAGQEIKGRVSDMLDQAEREIDKEKQAIGIVKKALRWK